MKTILFITSASLVDPKRGTPIRIYNFIKELQKKQRVIVSALAVEPGYTQGFDAYPGGSLWSLIKYYRPLIKQYRPDLVMTATDVDIDLPVWLKWLTGVKIAIDLHGLYAAEARFHGHMGRVKSWLLQQKINFLIRSYDLVFVVSPKLAVYYGSKLKHSVVVYDGVTEREFYRGPIVALEIFTIGYTGNANPYQGVDFLLKAASELKRQKLFPFRLNLIMSNGRREIEDKLKELDLFDLTTLHFKVPHEQVPTLIARSTVLVVPRPSTPMTEYSYPSKLPGYLATGVPVITTRVGPIAELFEGADCLLIVESDNIEKNLEQALIHLYQMTAPERLALGQRGIIFVRERLHWDTLGRIINQSLMALPGA